MPWFHRLSFFSPRSRATRACSPATRLTLEILESRTLLSADPSLTLVLASHTIAENSGPAATTGTITRNNMDTSQALTINLTSSNTSQATVPASVTIAAGAASATFNVDAVDDDVVNPTQTVTITATAASPLAAGPDATFGSNGFANVQLQESNSANFPDVKVQSDGKIVAVAASQASGATWAVTRTNPDGTPDTSFGNNGTVNTPFINSTGGYANGVAIQPDGKIIVVGTVNLSTSNYSAWGIARYNTNGTLDTTFGSGGLVTIPFSGEAGWAYDAALLPNGEILVGGMLQQPGGFAVARLTSTGQIDTSFGSGGFASINPDPTHSWYNTTGQAMIVQPDGKILMTGIANYNYLPVVRFNANGTPDTSFGSNGTRLIPLSAFGSYASIQGYGLALQGDGKIVVVGSANRTNSNYDDWVVARLNTDGSLDTGFSGDGLTTLSFSGGDNQARDVAVQTDGKILVGGQTLVVGTGYFLALARYNADGTLDTTFNGTGELTTTPPGPFESIWGMDLQADGKLDTIAGYYTSMYVVRYDTGLLAASDSLSVTDTDGLLSADPSLTLVLASHTIAENSGPAATTGTITRNNMDTSQALTVNLTSSNISQATVPASVTIPAGAASTTFNVDAVDNQIVDPTQTVVITATAASPLPAGLDSTFGSGGFANVTLNYSSSANFPDVKVQPDGKIVAVAGSQTSGATWSVSRTNADGTADTSFGNNGTVVTTFPGSSGGYANGIAFQPDGKIIVVGTVNTSTSNYDAWGIARYNADGTPDTTFGTNGLLTVQFTGEAGWLYDAAVLPDGEILVGGMLQQPGGFAVARLTSKGQIDTTFGSGGFASINPDPTHNWFNTTGQAMMVQPDGKILMTGIANFNYLPVVRFNADGTPDTTFNGTGTRLIPLSAFGPSYATIEGDGLALQSDGKILVVGDAAHTSAFNSDWVVARLNPDGALDTSFSGDGVNALDFAGGDDHARDVAVQADGKILVGGQEVVPGTGFFLALARYNSDGTLDQTFNGTGELTTKPPSPFESIWGMDLQTDGKLATIAGYTNSMHIVRYDTGLLAASDSLNVTDTDGAPKANAGGPYTVPEGGTVQLDASSTTDPAQDPSTLTYTWDLNGDQIYGETGADATHGDEVGISPTFSAAGLNGPGSYVVHLKVTDSRGLTSFAEATINITNVNPSVQAGDDVPLNEGDTLSRTGSFTDPGPDTWTATVDYGDGSNSQPLSLNADNTFALNHTYQEGGSYQVTVTVTDSDNGVGTASFLVTVKDPAPVVDAGPDATINEGDTLSRTGSFTDPGPDTWTATVDYGDGGGSQPLTLNSDGTFNLSHAYADNGSYHVAVVVTDDDNISGTSNFTVTVNNLAPTATLSNSGPVDENSPVTVRFTNQFDPSSADTQAGFHYSFATDPSQLATSYAGATDGPSKTFTFLDGPASPVVYGRIFDKDGGFTDYQTTVTVNDVAPTATVSGPTATVQGQAQTFTFMAADVSPIDQAGGFSYTIDWGDNSTDSLKDAASTVSLSHVFTAAGTNTIQVWATDKDSKQSSSPGTLTVTVKVAALENNGQGNDLVVGGTTGNDTIVLKPADTAGNIFVSVNGAQLGPYHPTGRIIIYAQAGDDNVQLQSATFGTATVSITVPAFIFGGDGNDTINAVGSSANNVLVGGDGADTLTGGGGRNILIGGGGADMLHGGGGGDILIGGTTDYDTNLAALAILVSEWGRTDLSYQQRIDHLLGSASGGLNGSTYLNAKTVHDDSAVDQLFGQGGSDWFFARTSGSLQDSVHDRKHGEVITPIM